MLRNLKSRLYKLRRKHFSVEFKEGEEDSEEDGDSKMLKITNIPDSVGEEYLKIVLSHCLDMDMGEDFEMQFFGHQCKLIFKQSYSVQGMCNNIQ